MPTIYGIRSTLCVCASCREIPEAEVESVAEYLDRLLSCDVGWLPTEALTHNFWTVHGHHMTHLADYITCIRDRNLTYPRCQELNPSACGRRFGSVDDGRNAQCRNALWVSRYDNSHNDDDDGGKSPSSAVVNASSVDDRLNNEYADYLRCMSILRSKVIGTR